MHILLEPTVMGILCTDSRRLKERLGLKLSARAHLCVHAANG